MPMIPILNYPDIDGARYSRTSVDLSVTATQTIGNVTSPILPSIRIEGWTSWTYSRELVPGKSWGHRAKPQTRTRGKFTPAAELGLFMEDYILLERYLAAAGAPRGRGAFEQSFQLTAVLYELALNTTRWDMTGCRIEKEGSGPEKENDDELEVKLTLNVMDILRDSLSVVFENTPFGQIGVIVTV